MRLFLHHKMMSVQFFFWPLAWWLWLVWQWGGWNEFDFFFQNSISSSLQVFSCFKYDVRWTNTCKGVFVTQDVYRIVFKDNVLGSTRQLYYTDTYNVLSDTTYYIKSSCAVTCKHIRTVCRWCVCKHMMQFILPQYRAKLAFTGL